MTMNKILILSIFLPLYVFGQDQIKPGVVYQSGQKLLGPRYGIVTKVPDNWVGILPQDTELFLLMSTQGIDGQILAMAYENDLEGIRHNWENDKLEGEMGTVLQKSGDIFERNGAIAAEFEVKGSTGQRKRAYAEAKCGDYGKCIVFLMLCPENYYVAYKKGLQEFCDNTLFEEPSLQNIYQNFDWKEFLSNKYLATFASNTMYKRDNQLWLCPDGTFKIRIKNKNWGSVPNEYQGNNSGTYEISGIGTTGEILLKFKKLEAVPIAVEIKDEKIYVNGDRFYVMENTDCK